MTSRASPLAMAIAVSLVLLAIPARSALAYRLFRTSRGAVMRWQVDAPAEVTYTLDARGLADLPDQSRVRALVAAGFQTWAAVRCTRCAAEVPACEDMCPTRDLSLQFVDLGWTNITNIGVACLAPTPGPANQPCTRWGPDGNRVVFVADAAEWTFGSFVAAFTLVTAIPATGRIVDADIAVNDADFTFCDGDCAAQEVDFGAMILHETGHFIGLDHSSEAGAVMASRADPTTLAPGPLNADDIAGVCAVYGPIEPSTCPTADAGGSTQPPTRSAHAVATGCAAQPTSPDGWPGALLFVVALLIRLRRRRSPNP